MKRIRLISKRPEHAVASPEVKIAFVIQVLEASLPLFRNKDPDAPIIPPTNDGNSGNS